MSDRDHSTFRMIPPMRETVQVTYHRLVRVKPAPGSDERPALRLVLRTVLSVKDRREFVLNVPQEMERETNVAVRRFITQRMKGGSLIDDLLPLSGVMFRGIILWRSMLDDELMTDAYTLSVQGDESTFPISNPLSAVLLALFKERPIMIERKLIEEQPIIRHNPNEHNEMSFIDRYTDYSDIVEKHIRQGLGTQLYREGEPEETFLLMGAKRLEELRDLAVSLESFEWAKLITDFLGKYHPSSNKPDEEDNPGEEEQRD